ncbi:hypothetical protein FRC00_008020, partial [Tulasnella sp. 408]
CRTGDEMGHANALMRLGELFSTQSEYAKAEEFCKRTLKKYSRIGANLGQANVKSDLGHLYHMQGIHTKAARLFAEARSLYALIGNSRLEKDSSY